MLELEEVVSIKEEVFSLKDGEVVSFKEELVFLLLEEVKEKSQDVKKEDISVIKSIFFVAFIIHLF